MARNAGGWSGRGVDQARAFIARQLPAPCGKCGKTITTTEPFNVGHIKARSTHPELTWVPSNWQPEHKRCSNASGVAGIIEKAKHDALREAAHKTAGQGRFSGTPPSSANHRPFRDMSPRRDDVSRFEPDSLVGVPWLADLLDKPADAAWPRLMTPVHPDARGSYGSRAEAWLRDEVGVRMRWWQRLATYRQLEHDAEGVLVWRQVVESTPRRSGKSVRLRSMALWRIAHAELFGEEQLAMFTGKDLPICKEIHRRSWHWAESRGWGVRRLNGHEEVAAPDGSRWLVRGKDSVFGYDTTLGMVDEAWAVAPTVVDDGLEPSVMERSMPQVVLTSTAHRRATSLMRRRISSAVAGMGEDWSTLLMVWGADELDDIGDEETWRGASPHWTADRLEVISGKFERAMRGEADPETDDVDPIEGFRAQYLNVWPEAAAPRQPPGEPVVSPQAWAELAGPVETSDFATSIAVEAWFAEGVSVACASRMDDGRVGVSVRSFADLPSAAEFAAGVPTLRLRAGKSIARDPGLVGSEPVGSTSRQAVAELTRMLADGVLVHDGSDVLTDQVLALRVVPSPDGPRLKSTGRHDAVKAAVWAVDAARVAAEAPAVF